MDKTVTLERSMRFWRQIHASKAGPDIVDGEFGRQKRESNSSFRDMPDSGCEELSRRFQSAVGLDENPSCRRADTSDAVDSPNIPARRRRANSGRNFEVVGKYPIRHHSNGQRAVHAQKRHWQIGGGYRAVFVHIEIQR